VGRCSLFSHHRSTENFSVQKLGLKCKSSSSCCFVAHLVLHFIPSLRTLCRERDRDRDGNRRRAGSSHTLQGTRCYVASLLRSCGLLCDLKVGSQWRCQPSCLLPLQGRNCCLHSGALGFLHRDVSKCRGGEGSIK